MSKRFYYIGLVVASMIAAVIMYLTLDIKKQVNEKNMVLNDTTLYVLPIDSLSIDTMGLDSPDSVIVENYVNKRKYHIIIGSFKNVENAKKFQYIYDDCKILPVTENGFHCVSILEYDNYDLCLDKLISYRENGGKAWMLILPE